MTFRFNFTLDDSVKDVNESKEEDKDLKTVEQNFISREILAKECKELPSDVPILMYKVKSRNTEISYYDSTAIEKFICEKNTDVKCIIAAASTHSDLIPKVYEGGLTLWECSLDLIDFLSSETNVINLNGKSILELGCGAGLPGLFAMTSGARHVDFQDYNEEVLQYYTIPNIKLLGNTDSTWHCYCGDWSTLSQRLQHGHRYDIILTAETIYNTESYDKLHQVFDDCLAEDGQIFLAAKSVYFGVGGTTRLFENYVKSQSKFHSEVCHTVEAGVPREILCLTRVKTDVT